MNGFRFILTIELGFGWFVSILVVSVGLKTIRVCWSFDIFVELGRFYKISMIWHIGVVSGRFWNILIWLFVLVCLSFDEFELIGWIWADFNRFGWTFVDTGHALKGLRWI